MRGIHLGRALVIGRAAFTRMWAAPGRWSRLLLAGACLLIVSMYCTNSDMNHDPDSPRGDGTYRPVLARGDGHMMYLMARSTALDLDWNFDNDLKRFGDPWFEPRTKTGRKAIVHPIGPALAWTPLIWIAEAGAVVANVFGADIALHGYTLWHQRFVFLSSALFACGTVLLGAWLARRLGAGRWAAAYAAVAILLGTSLTYYATYMPSYAHAMDAAASAGFLAYWAATIGRRDRRRWLALGVLLGVAALIRVQELALGVVVALEIAVEVVRARRDRRVALAWIAGGALALGVAIVVFIPQLVEWHVVFGDATALPQGAAYTRPGSPMVLELLFSARNGWLVSTPIAYAALIGIALVPKRARFVAVALGLAVAIQIYLDSTILDWWGGSSFGQRRLCNVTLPLVVGLAALLARLRGFVARWPRIPRGVWHALAALGLGSCVTWNLARVGELRAGKAASSELVPTCCGRIARWLRPAIEAVYDRIGNPFELPASALYALRHGVELQRWDHAVGRYPLVPAFGDVRGDRLAGVRGKWSFGSAAIKPFLLDGWSTAVTADRTFRYTLAPVATAVIPNLMPNDQRWTLWLAAAGSHDVTISYDDETVAHAALGTGWTAVQFDLRAPAVGDHELSIEATPAAVAPGWPDPHAPVGVAVGDLELVLR